jgi:hypothetical protein
MTLPFEDRESKSQRKWQCFVCGVEYKTYEDFCTHIRDTHEEGREYLNCPKCAAPVRDMKMHYKLKHKGWDVPPGQHRVTLWADFSSGKAKKKPNVKFRDGTFVSGKMNGKELHYRSGYECEVYELLEQLPNVVCYDAEPLEIPYLHNGKWRKYRPDLSILFDDGHKEIWEIKPKTQTSLPINEAKWTYAVEFCQGKGWEFQVLTEIGIGKMRATVNNMRKK